MLIVKYFFTEDKVAIAPFQSLSYGNVLAVRDLSFDRHVAWARRYISPQRWVISPFAAPVGTEPENLEAWWADCCEWMDSEAGQSPARSIMGSFYGFRPLGGLVVTKVEERPEFRLLSHPGYYCEVELD